VKADPDEPEIGYADAVAELESILDELEGEAVDVDVLASRVRRAAVLIRLCRERIAGASLEIEHIVAELDDDGPGDVEPTEG
jgi:exodeoxyribonuclease VII small subunit